MLEGSLRYLVNLYDVSFDMLMRDYGQEVWNFAYSIVKNQSMADDITQDEDDGSEDIKLDQR